MSSGGLWLTNTIIKVNGLDQDAFTQEYCGAVARRTASMDVKYKNSYVIAKGTLFSKLNDKSNRTYVEMNKHVEILFGDAAEFALAKAAGEISLDGYNECWNLAGTIPEFH